jgi:hypothetical protein
MKLLLASLLALLAASSHATPYARPFDAKNIHQSAGCGFDTTGNSPMACTTDIAILTHDTSDGSIIPWAWQPLLPPEDWAVSVGGGGSIKGEAVINASATSNVAPQLASLALKGITNSSPAWAQDVKTFAEGTGALQLRLGIGFYGNAVVQGHFQSFAAAFPGRGIGDILNRAKRLEVGVAWKFKP